MFEMVYSRGKKLKDDLRPTYYSFCAIFKFPEVVVLAIFSVFYTASSGMNIELAHPINTKMQWPFEYYTYGAASGLTLVILISDFIFE